jgi:hypothetical protein
MSAVLCMRSCKAERRSRGSCSLRGDTRLRMMQEMVCEARRSERGRDGLAVPGAPGRGWEERAAPIAKLAQARGGSRPSGINLRVRVSWGSATQREHSPLRGNSIPVSRYSVVSPLRGNSIPQGRYAVHLEETRSQLDVTRVGAGGSSRKGRRRLRRAAARPVVGAAEGTVVGGRGKGSERAYASPASV